MNNILTIAYGLIKKYEIGSSKKIFSATFRSMREWGKPHFSCIEEYSKNFSMVSLNDLLKLKNETISIQFGQKYRKITIHNKGNGISISEIITNHSGHSEEKILVPQNEEILLVSSSNARLGAFSYAYFPTNKDVPVVLSDDSYVFTVADPEKVSLKYINVIVHQDEYIHLLHELGKLGGMRKRVIPRKFASIEIPLPPIDMQLKFCKEIDKQERIIIDALKKQKEKIEDLTQFLKGEQ